MLLVTVSFSGCLDTLWNDITRPDIQVQRTPLDTNGWNTDPRFTVLVNEPEPARVVIVATQGDETLVQEAFGSINQPVEILLPDGVWTIEYTVADHPWETFEEIRFDSTPPVIEGLELTGSAQNGVYLLGADARPEPGASIDVIQGGSTVAAGLPVEVQVEDGLTSLLVVATDEAGNERTYTVQVRSGDADFLPDGQWDFGVVARYTNAARVWDLSDLDAYLMPADAAAATNGGWLEAGHGVTPEAPAVQQVVADVVAPEDTTAEVAWKLYRWMFDNLEYDEERLSADDLLDPEATMDNGGGVCRDLAAAYVSLLRAAGVPARLVSGYLAGEINGFHAWVDVYVGNRPGNPGPWMPVDVSPMDGAWDDEGGDGIPHGVVTAMTSFGISLPEYLALRTVPSPEPEGWSTALSVHYSYPESSGEPDVRFEKALIEETGAQAGRLCFDATSLARTIGDECAGHYFPFTVSTQRTLDYGIHVVAAGPGTHIDAGVAIPFPLAVAPDHVDFQVYGQSYTVQGGQATASFMA